jgi:formate C-acetyltransferase
LTGIGTLVDSLFAIREVVYEHEFCTDGKNPVASSLCGDNWRDRATPLRMDNVTTAKLAYEQKQVSLTQFKEILARNFEGEEAFRQYLIHRVAKFGQEEDAIRDFSARVFADLARVSSGRENSRGGRYEASLFAFRSFTGLGTMTGATPDGRRAGEYLSQSMSPSVLSLGEQCDIGQVLSALESINLTLYPVTAVLDVKLPAFGDGCGSEVIVPVIKRFLHNGGSVLQMNSVDPKVLLEARKHPQRHPDLVVRVTGYSAYFNTLPEAVQDEVIERTLVTHSAL